MKLQRCPECGIVLTQEMLDVNMCWECGKILNESELDKKTFKKYKTKQEK